MTGCFPSEENIRANCTCKCHRLPNNIGCTECKCKPYFGKNNQAPNWDSSGKEKFSNEYLFEQIHGLTNLFANLIGRVDNIAVDVKQLHIHHVRQVDENRKISARVDKIETSVSKIEAQNQEFFDANPIAVIEKRIDQIGANLKLLSDLHDIVRRSLDMVRVIDRDKPHVCPVCDGCGNSKGQIEPNPNYEFSMKYASCHSCEGKGVLWG